MTNDQNPMDETPQRPQPGAGVPAASDPAAPPQQPGAQPTPPAGTAASDAPTQAIPDQTPQYGPPGYPAQAPGQPQTPVQPPSYGQPQQPVPPQQHGQPSHQNPYPGQQYARPYPGQTGQQYPSQPGSTAPQYGQYPQAGAPYAAPQGASYAQPYPGQPGQQYPGQPYAGQAGQPYAGQPTSAQQYPGQAAYGQGLPPQPPNGGPPQKPKNKAPLLVALGVGGLIVILIAVSALTRGSTAATTPSTGATTGGASGSAPPQSADAASAVRGYLEALASGDSATALSYAAAPPTETSLLTDEVLAASLADAPISDITTAAGTGSDHQTVTASYTLGATPVSTTFDASLVSGVWLLDSVAVPLPVDTSAAQGVELTVNGVALTDSANVFPGQYTIASADKWYRISGGTIDVVDTTAGADPATVTVKLSDSGVSAIRKAAQAKLDSCIAKHSLTPKDCGFSTWLPGKNKVRPATINWDVTSGSNAMKKLKPKLFAAGSATGNVSVKTRVYCYSTNGIHWRGYSSIHSVYATLSDGKVTITFGL